MPIQVPSTGALTPTGTFSSNVCSYKYLLRTGQLISMGLPKVPKVLLFGFCSNTIPWRNIWVPTCPALITRKYCLQHASEFPVVVKPYYYYQGPSGVCA